MKIVCTILSLIVVSSFAQMNLHQRIDKTMSSQLGNTLIKTVALQLESNQPLDRQYKWVIIERLLDTLFDLEDRYNEDQKDDDKENREFQSKCDDDLRNLGSDIDQITVHITKLNGQLAQMKSQLESKKQTFRDQEEIRKDLRKGMNEVDVVREYEEKLFSEKRAEMANVIKMLEEIKVTYATKFRSNFMELQSENTQVSMEVMVQIQNTLKNHPPFKHFGKPFEVILTYISQVKGNKLGLLRNIIDLAELLIKRVDQTWTEEKKAEDARTAWYNNYQKLMGTDFKKHDDVYFKLKNDIEQLASKIKEIEGKISDLQQRMDGKKEMKDDRFEECQEAAFNYAERRAQRLEDREVVSDVIGIINVNMRDLKQEIALRMAAVSLE